ncbi:MAG: hypothetical protein ACU83N_05540 [Gammaproteobacteria bacterium]
MNMKILFILLIGLVLQACENSPVRRQEMIAMHPEWDQEYVQLIQAGYLARGMDQEQVKAAWGRPCWSCTGTTKGDWGESWEYATQVVFFDLNGKVIRWEMK